MNFVKKIFIVLSTVLLQYLRKSKKVHTNLRLESNLNPIIISNRTLFVFNVYYI